MPFFDAAALKEWFAKEKRDFPWRRNPTPYAVWISEVMLQQTQASVVVPYFEKWMRRFPNIRMLAEAQLDEVMKMWEGLGYYSRARHLHIAAHQLLKEHGGELPQDREALNRIKGIGPYTKGAILSFAFHQKAAAVDGNVLRVLSRYFTIQEPIQSAKRRCFELNEAILPEKEPWVVMEALIELGAQICRKQPLCTRCPIKNSCQAYHEQVVHLFPTQQKRQKSTLLKRSVLVLICKHKLFVRKVAEKQVMAGLYEFPYIERVEDHEEICLMKEKITQQFKLIPELFTELPSITHSFTRYHATLYPSLWRVQQAGGCDGFEWIELETLFHLPFSSGHKKILQACASYILKVQMDGVDKRSGFLKSP